MSQEKWLFHIKWKFEWQYLITKSPFVPCTLKYGAFLSPQERQSESKAHRVFKVVFYWERNEDVWLKEVVTIVFIKVKHNTFCSPVGKGMKARYEQAWLTGKPAYKWTAGVWWFRSRKISRKLGKRQPAPGRAAKASQGTCTISSRAALHSQAFLCFLCVRVAGG